MILIFTSKIVLILINNVIHTECFLEIWLKSFVLGTRNWSLNFEQVFHTLPLWWDFVVFMQKQHKTVKSWSILHKNWTFTADYKVGAVYII